MTLKRLLAFSIFSALASSQAMANDWFTESDVADLVARETEQVTLGETYLTNRTQADYIAVPAGRGCNVISFKLGARGDGAQIDDVKVVFGNGQVQDIAVRRRIEPNTSTPWADLRGDQRCITGIYIYGKSFSRTPRQTRIVFTAQRVLNNTERQLLGSTRLANTNQLDVITLPRPVCGLTQFKIGVRGDSAQINFLIVQFNNGQTQQIGVARTFRPGTQSQWKDLNGGSRCISRILVSGRSGSNPRQAIVDFYGLRNER